MHKQTADLMRHCQGHSQKIFGGSDPGGLKTRTYVCWPSGCAQAGLTLWLNASSATLCCQNQESWATHRAKTTSDVTRLVAVPTASSCASPDTLASCMHLANQSSIWRTLRRVPQHGLILTGWN